MLCCALLNVHSSFAVISMETRELVALLSLSFWCLVIIVWLFLAMAWVCLQFVIVIFPDRTHLLFLESIDTHIIWNLVFSKREILATGYFFYNCTIFSRIIGQYLTIRKLDDGHKSYRKHQRHYAILLLIKL